MFLVRVGSGDGKRVAVARVQNGEILFPGIGGVQVGGAREKSITGIEVAFSGATIFYLIRTDTHLGMARFSTNLESTTTDERLVSVPVQWLECTAHVQLGQVLLTGLNGGTTLALYSLQTGSDTNPLKPIQHLKLTSPIVYMSRMKHTHNRILIATQSALHMLTLAPVHQVKQNMQLQLLSTHSCPAFPSETRLDACCFNADTIHISISHPSASTQDIILYSLPLDFTASPSGEAQPTVLSVPIKYGKHMGTLFRSQMGLLGFANGYVTMIDFSQLPSLQLTKMRLLSQLVGLDVLLADDSSSEHEDIEVAFLVAWSETQVKVFQFDDGKGQQVKEVERLNAKEGTKWIGVLDGAVLRSDGEMVRLKRPSMSSSGSAPLNVRYFECGVICTIDEASLTLSKVELKRNELDGTPQVVTSKSRVIELGFKVMHVSVTQNGCLATNGKDQLVLDMLDGSRLSEPVDIRADGGMIKCVSLAYEYVCIQTGSKVHVYQVSTFEHLFELQTSASTIAIVKRDILHLCDMETGWLRSIDIPSRKQVFEHAHPCGLRDFKVMESGTRVVFVDVKGALYCLSCATSTLIHIHTEFEIVSCSLYQTQIVAWNQNSMAYVDLKGNRATSIEASTFKRDSGSPVGILDHVVLGLSKEGDLVVVNDLKKLDIPVDELIRRGDVSAALKSLQTVMNTGEEWTQRSCLMDPAQVYYTLSTIRSSIQDQNELMGELHCLLGSFDAAEEFFLKSTQPRRALDMRRFMFDWNRALQLAETLNADIVSELSFKYAEFLEHREKYGEALKFYQKALDGLGDQQSEHGFVRCLAWTGDIFKAIKRAKELKHAALLADVAQICVQLKQFEEAADLFESAGLYNQTLECALKIKMNRVPLYVGKVTDISLLVELAQKLESMQRYQDAYGVYEQVSETESMCRLLLTQLSRHEDGIDLVRRTNSKPAAKAVAKYFKDSKLNDEIVVEFLMMAGEFEDAFEYAKSTDQFEVYAKGLEKDQTAATLEGIAKFFERRGEWYMAGRYWSRVGKDERALNCLFQSKSDKGLDLAIDIAVASDREDFTGKVLKFLTAQLDRYASNSKHLLRLYLLLEDYDKASELTVYAAKEHQKVGDYKAARDVLFSTCRAMKKAKVSLPQETSKMLMIHHSYNLAKIYLRHGDHELGTRLLLRVAAYIDMFPQHQVPILTTTVVECLRVGMKRAAFNYAAILCRPENRDQIDPKFKKKIELLVRRPAEQDDFQEEGAPCPACHADIPESVLDCPKCSEHLPYCIASGLHVSGDPEEYFECPSCSFPAIHSRIRKLFELDTSRQCPMCQNVISKL